MIDIISRGIAATALKEVVELKDFVVSHMVQTDLIKIVTVLPDVGEENKIYLVPKEVGEISEKDYYDEYNLFVAPYERKKAVEYIEKIIDNKNFLAATSIGNM